MKEKMSKILRERIRISNELNDNWWDGIDNCWKASLELLTEDLGRTRQYFLEECSDEEFFYLSEIFEEIIEKTQDATMLEVLSERLARVSRENYQQDKFTASHMKKSVSYERYVQKVNQEIGYAAECLRD